MSLTGFNLCSPALIYLVFSMTQVIVDTIKGYYNVATLKFFMMILFTLLLNILCERGLGIISWIIVFVPFILMSVITSILLFVFGLDPSSGRIIPPPSATTAIVVNKKQTERHPEEVNEPTRIKNVDYDREQYVRRVLDKDGELESDQLHHHQKSTQNKLSNTILREENDRFSM